MIARVDLISRKN